MGEMIAMLMMMVILVEAPQDLWHRRRMAATSGSPRTAATRARVKGQLLARPGCDSKRPIAGCTNGLRQRMAATSAFSPGCISAHLVPKHAGTEGIPVSWAPYYMSDCVTVGTLEKLRCKSV